jgi:hypothetical protein
LEIVEGDDDDGLGVGLEGGGVPTRGAVAMQIAHRVRVAVDKPRFEEVGAGDRLRRSDAHPIETKLVG